MISSIPRAIMAPIVDHPIMTSVAATVALSYFVGVDGLYVTHPQTGEFQQVPLDQQMCLESLEWGTLDIMDVLSNATKIAYDQVGIPFGEMCCNLSNVTAVFFKWHETGEEVDETMHVAQELGASFIDYIPSWRGRLDSLNP